MRAGSSVVERMSVFLVGKLVSRRRVSTSVAFLTVLVPCACGEAEDPAAAPVVAPLEEVFAIEAVIQLGEDPADSIAEIGDFGERRSGGYVIGDRHLPRVRTYDEEGRLEAAFGRFGDGPFEFQRIRAVAEASSGRIVVASSRSSFLTYLTRSLAPDTMVALPAAVMDVLALGSDLLVRMNAGDPQESLVGRPPLLHRVIPPELVWSSYELPFSPSERPYWGSFSNFPVAVSSDSIFVMSGVRYPITVIDGAGATVGTFGAPSASFRQIPVLESGMLANLGSYGTTLPAAPRELRHHSAHGRGRPAPDPDTREAQPRADNASLRDHAHVAGGLRSAHRSQALRGCPASGGIQGPGRGPVSVPSAGRALSALADREAATVDGEMSERPPIPQSSPEFQEREVD